MSPATARPAGVVAQATLDELSQASVGGTVVGVERPLAAVALPVALAAVGWLVLRGRGDAARRSRWALAGSRALVALLLVTAAAGPYTVGVRETPGEPRVTMLVDESASTDVLPNVTGDLRAGIRDAGVPVDRVTIASGNRSRVGDGIAANLRENGTVLAVTDGRVTGGDSLSATADRAARLNATVSSVELSPRRTERAVSVAAPEKVSTGVETTFSVRVDGVRVDRPQVEVRIDGDRVETAQVSEGGVLDVDHTFDETGAHRIEARVVASDGFGANDVARATVRAVERPAVLYVSQRTLPLRNYLEDLYDVTVVESVPDDLSPYYAVVMQDTAAADAGNVSALQRFVIEGNGLVVAGGPNAYGSGGYAESPLAATLPVEMGESEGGSARIVLLIDISGSAESGLQQQKAIALDVLDQLGDENRVGVVAFNWQAYRIADPVRLEDGRERIETRIRQLKSGGATEIEAGLRGARDMLGRQQGTVILLSDGGDDAAAPTVVARGLGRDGVRVLTVGVGQRVETGTLRRIAEASGGTFFRASETERLRVLFGGAGAAAPGEGLTVIDGSAFITRGVQLSANPGQSNAVSVKRGADFLVATDDGNPALATWRFGLGRVASLTTYDADGTLDGLLTQPDSVLLTRTVNWAVGDPERKRTGIARADDTRVGEPTTISYRGGEPPSIPGATFRAVAPERYEASVTPETVGFRTTAGATYAVNYPREYTTFGQSAALDRLVESTGGRIFAPDETAAIARQARESARRVREVREEWTWLAALLALVVFVVEVCARRVQVYRGRTDIP